MLSKTRKSLHHGRKHLFFKSFLLILGLSLMLSLVILLWQNSILSKPKETVKGGVDFLAYYSGGYIIRYKTATELYNLEIQKNIQEAILHTLDLKPPRFYPYNHPPVYVGILGLATTYNFNASYFRWIFILFLFHLGAIGFFLQLMRALTWQKTELLLSGVTILLFYPIHLSYARGQDTAILLFGVTLWVYGLLLKKDKVTTLGLALSLVRPQVGLVLILPTLFNDIKRLRWLIIWGGILFLLNYPFIRMKGITDYIQMLRFSGQGYGFDVDRMATLMGAILRASPNINVNFFHAIGYGVYFSTIIFLSILWKKTKLINFTHISFAILLNLFVSPHLHNHDLSLLLIPAIGVAVVLSKKKILSQKHSILVPIIISLLLPLQDILESTTIVYFIILLLAILLWLPKQFNHKITKTI